EILNPMNFVSVPKLFLACSATDTNTRAKNQEKMWGRASQCRLVVPNSKAEVAAVKNKFAPRKSARRAAAEAVMAIMTAASSETPASPVRLWTKPSVTSDNHSQANHRAPERV